MTEPRNWDKELADIDKVIEKHGSEAPSQRGSPALPAPQSRAPAAPLAGDGRRGSVTRTWFWTVLALLLGVALPIWPYGKECGLQFFFFLGAATLALLAGLAGAVAAWSTRSGLAHVLSLLVVIWSGAMGAREVLPRIGYAAQAKTWLCPSVPEAAPPGPPAGETPPPVGTGQPQT
jgi:hypothetical protein